VAFSPDGKLLAPGEGAMVVRIFRADTGKHAREFPHPDKVSGLAFSPDGALLAVSGNTGTGQVYKVADGKKGWEYQGRVGAFSADGKSFVTAVPAGAIRHWDAVTGKLKGEVKTAPHQPWLAASADLVAVVSWNPLEKDVRRWDLATGTSAGELKGHEKNVSSVAVSSDGAHAASASEDQTLRLWNLPSGHFAGHMVLEHIAFLAFAPSGRQLAVAQGNRLELYAVAW
jgi:WD40 repeat protein